MSVEYIGERIFLDEVASSRQVWVARNTYKNIYAQEIDREGFSLPVWSSREKVVLFLRNALLVGPKYEPHPIPLDEFTNAWLCDQQKGIFELQINPDGRSSRVLALTAEEFQASQAS